MPMFQLDALIKESSLFPYSLIDSFLSYPLLQLCVIDASYSSVRWPHHSVGSAQVHWGEVSTAS